MSACEIVTNKTPVGFKKYSQGLCFFHHSQAVFAYTFRLKVLEQMLEDVSCGYWDCGRVVIRVQGNIFSAP